MKFWCKGYLMCYFRTDICSFIVPSFFMLSMHTLVFYRLTRIYIVSCVYLLNISYLCKCQLFKALHKAKIVFSPLFIFKLNLFIRKVWKFFIIHVSNIRIMHIFIYRRKVIFIVFRFLVNCNILRNVILLEYKNHQ